MRKDKEKINKICDDIIKNNSEMTWLNDYHKNKKTEEKEKRKEIEENILKEAKKKHLSEKQEKLESLKQKLKQLEQEISSYTGVTYVRK